MPDCLRRAQLTSKIRTTAEDLRVILELELKVIAEGDTLRMSELESTVARTTERYREAVEMFRQHVEAHGCFKPKGATAD